MSDFEQTRTLIRRRLGLEDIHAVLGDENGVVYDDPLNRKGDMRVRYVTASALSLPPALPQGPNYVGQDTPGTPVICRYDNNNQLVVWGNDIPGQKANGMNPVANNPAATVNQETTSTETFIPFSSSPTSPASAFIVVRSHIWNNAGTRTLFAAGDDDGSGGFKGKKDLTAFFPSAGNHRLIAYFLKTDNTLEIVGSTTQPIPEPLDFTDILELFAAASANALPGQAWHLADGQTTLVQGNYWIDLRDIINGSASGSVNGPGTSTDRAIATWNGTAGNALRDNPNATIDASGNLSAPKLTAFDTDPQAFIDGSSSAAIYLRDRGSGSDLKNFRILNDAGVLSIAQINDAFSTASLFMQFTASSLLTAIVNRLSTQSGENHKVRVVTAAGAVTVATTDYIIVVNKSSGAATTCNLPSSPTTGDVYCIKDGKFDAATNNISIVPASGNIENAANYVMNINGQSTTVVYSGSQWLVI